MDDIKVPECIGLKTITWDEIKEMKATIEKLQADSVHGWRSCIDHIIKPESDCPVCKIEQLQALVRAARCPCCNGDGAYYDNYGEVCQCQWCDEVNKLAPKEET